MGERLVEYYEYAGNKGQLLLQIKLAMKTCMALPDAKVAPDSPENVAMFYDALRELVGDDPAIPKPVVALQRPSALPNRPYTFG
jgi:hypothetical protein